VVLEAADVELNQLDLHLDFEVQQPTRLGIPYFRALWGAAFPSEPFDLERPYDHGARKIALLWLLGLILTLTTGGFLITRKIRSELTKDRCIRALRTQDPQFDWRAFEDRVARTTRLLMKSWSQGQLETVRHLLSTGLYERLKTQLTLLKSVDEVSNRTESLKILRIRLLRHDTEGDYETVHLGLEAELKDLTLPEKTSPKEWEDAFQKARRKRFFEVHSYTRKKTAMTQVGRDAVERHDCPSCGAVASFSHHSVRCEHCGNIFNSGEKDWVLSEITQEVEWFRKSAAKAVTSLSCGVLEDLAAAKFWRLLAAAADLPDSATLLMRSLAPSVAPEGKQILGKLAGAHSVPVVGSLDVIAVHEFARRTEVQFEIRWSSRQLTGRRDISPVHRRSVLTLEWTESEGPPDTQGYRSDLDCKGCGAPLTQPEGAKCPWCAHPITADRLSGRITAFTSG
jgi:hypothetical protein